MKKLLFFLFLCSSLFAQYSNNDYDLLKTTFERKFESELLHKYLASNNHDSVAAALLSISHSNNKEWINEIINLNFESNGNYIAFALGQLGTSTISSQYLLNKIKSRESNKYIKECFEAFGNTADSSSILFLLDIINNNEIENYQGLPYALSNYNARFPLPEKELFIKFLNSEIRNSIDLIRKFDALFVLYRLGGSNDAKDVLLNVLNLEGSDSNPLKYYALGSLRRISYFPDDQELFNKLLNDKDAGIRIEARTLCFYEFKTFDMIGKYLLLLTDSNPNVSRQAAISIANINIDDKQKEKLYERIIDFINDSLITKNSKGELFVNYCNFKKDNYLELIEYYDEEIGTDFIFRVLSNNLTYPEKNFEYIKENIIDTTEIDFLNIAQSILPLQDSLSYNPEFNKFILSILNSSSSIGISLIADNLDSLIISKNINALQQIVIEQVFRFVNNSNYYESIKSLFELAKKISTDFADEILQICKTSNLNWIKFFAKKQLGKETLSSESKDIDFNILWNYAFKYSHAKVNTNKGSFIIKLTSVYAPISVGNFCYLISKKYYEGSSFHRVVPNFVIQTGDPGGTGWGGPGYEIVSEFSLQPFNEAYVGMASSGKDTEGSQWFVMHSNFPHLNWRYTNFGKVTSGMNVVNLIDQKDKIINIELLK